MRWNSARFEDQPGPTSCVSREKDQSLRTEWAYICRFARRWRSCPPCPCPCLRRGHRSLLGSPPPALRCLSAFCCPPVAPNPCLHPRRLLPLPLFGQSSVSRCSAERRGDALAPVPGVVAPPLAGSSCRPSLRVAALSRWGRVSWPASSMKSLRKETLSEILVSASGKPYPVPRDTGVPCNTALLTSLLTGSARRGQEPCACLASKTRERLGSAAGGHGHE